tara:strand:- start:593 stop:832 length:240 start_codon:yes stop_codon:yes gene_type:complete
MLILIGIICFSAGFMLGSIFRTAVFDSQPWKIHKWKDDILGWRPVPEDYRIKKGDRVAMTLEIDTSALPEEGMVINDNL